MEISLQLQDAKPSAKIWRYMDLTKFLDLILNKAIYLRRIDKFEDPYEGYISEAYKADLENQYGSIQKEFNLAEEAKERLHSTHLYGLELLPMYAYASCWYLGDVESAAMWKLYGDNKNCVAICSTIYDLQVALDESDDDQGVIHLQKIRYVDEASAVDAKNYLKPMFEKRMSFSHESEFRALYLLRKGLVNLNRPLHFPQLKKEDVSNEDGLTLSVDVLKLINNIYISPTADQHFHSIVEKILELAGLNGVECIQSELYKLK